MARAWGFIAGWYYYWLGDLVSHVLEWEMLPVHWEAYLIEVYQNSMKESFVLSERHDLGIWRKAS